MRKKVHRRHFKVLLLVAINVLAIFILFLHLSFFIFSISIFLIVLLDIIAASKQSGLPLISTPLKKQYYKTKFRLLTNLDNKNRFKRFIVVKINKPYLRVLFYLILLFKKTEEGYQVVKEDVFNDSGLLFTKIKKNQKSKMVKALYLVERIKDKKQVRLSELEDLDQLLLDFYKQKQQKFTRLSAGTVLLLILATSTTSLISTLVLPKISNLKASSHGWVQTDWSGGADMVSVADHATNQANWIKFFSKDDSVSINTPGELSIDSSLVAITDTTDTDFNATTMTSDFGGFYITDGTIKLKKQNGATCTTPLECVGKFCTDGLCDGYLPGPCASILVFNEDIASGQKWKTSQSYCTSPQCVDGELVANNSVSFSLYPAREACRTIQGRLPTVSELQCIYHNKASYGDNFTTGFY